ncbi:LacI family DNA-binding transcriptional regulator [Sphingomonas metalli]|uniref:LacI family DNA-binding transcriptional regulator n=1 Tax=Sphingomonas metalli TaxID=1779358 RepID=UPI001E5EF3AA|nr:LacI family DNA-binding transcriptional regulator [Sphingomonas metalli]
MTDERSDKSLTALRKRPEASFREARPSGPPTLVDVARVAGVSPMTVSRVINEPSLVKPKTREAVQRAIAKLNYMPNTAARTLAGSKAMRLGLLLNDLEPGFLSPLLLGCLQTASARHVQVLVENVEGLSDPLAAAASLVDAQVDGVILPPPLCENGAVIDQLVGAGVPVVAITASLPDPRVMAVHIDDRSAAEAMTRHLLSQGHRAIGFIGGTPSLSASRCRFEGYCMALEAAGIALDERLVAQGYFTYQSGLAPAEALLTAEPRPTAIFACNDDMAAATVAVAHRLGIDVPADVAVCGFDDTVLASAIWPQLTTIRQPIVAMTQGAVGMLIDAIGRTAEQRGALEHRVYPHELVRRQSDAILRPSLDRQG